MDFSGKVAIITGSSSGIGAATAKLFANHGTLLTIVGRNEERLIEVANVCKSINGNKPLVLLLDLTHLNSCETLVQKTIETYGRLDIIVNCAGKIAVTSLFDDTMENFDEIVALNLRVPYKLTQIAVPYLKQTRGVIINIFGASLRPGCFLGNSMVRDALERFTKSGALELASVGVRMNAVRPGITRTNLLSNLNFYGDNIEQTYNKLSNMVPTKSIIEPEEVAKMILFAASDTCPNMTGSSIVVDGGLSANN